MNVGNQIHVKPTFVGGQRATSAIGDLVTGRTIPEIRGFQDNLYASIENLKGKGSFHDVAEHFTLNMLV